MSDENVYTYDETIDPMQPPPGHSHHWIGFWRSDQQIHRHYKAKCSFCHLTIPGRPQYLIKHKTKKCPFWNSWPGDVKKALKRNVTAPAENTAPLSKYKKTSEDTQPGLDRLFFKALVGTSIPFACVDDPHFRNFFKFVGVKIPNRCVRINLNF